MAMQRPNGWMRFDSGDLRGDFWLDGFPPATDPDEAYKFGRGTDKRVSPIYDYDSGGIGPIQWIHPLHDRAVILAGDGRWRNGGSWHVWYSGGPGDAPREITSWVIDGPRIVAGDNVHYPV
jgi:hypothetical protein